MNATVQYCQQKSHNIQVWAGTDLYWSGFVSVNIEPHQSEKVMLLDHMEEMLLDAMEDDFGEGVCLDQLTINKYQINVEDVEK